MNNELSVPQIYTKTDSAFALVMIICGFLYWNLIRVYSLGAGVTIFAGVFCLSVAVYLKSGNIKQTKGSLICLALILLSALTFSLFDSILIKGLNFIFLTAGVIYWICLTTGRNLNKGISIYSLGDFYSQILIVPFRNLTCCFSGISQFFKGYKKGRGILYGVLGILLILPVLILVISLLAKADAAFGSLIEILRQFTLSGVSIDYMIQAILGIPVACYLYGLIFGDKYGRYTGIVTLESFDRNTSAIRVAPGITVYSAMTALNVIFVIFFLSQASYLFSAFDGRLPELMTYAEYARRGFFELCAVSGINLAVISLAHITAKREKGKMLQIQTAALCLFTIMLIMTALSKMGMYINYYGLSQLRVLTSWFMLLLFFMFVVIAIRQFKKFNAARIMVFGFIACFMILSYGNIDGRIAEYNIERFQSGELETIDVQALSELSDSAVPYMYDLYNKTSNARLKADLRAAILRSKTAEAENLYKSTFRDYNLADQTADSIRNII